MKIFVGMFWPISEISLQFFEKFLEWTSCELRKVNPEENFQVNPWRFLGIFIHIRIHVEISRGILRCFFTKIPVVISEGISEGFYKGIPGI